MDSPAPASPPASSLKSRLLFSAKGEREIVLARRFDAARERVFDAFITPETLKAWLYGPANHRLTIPRFQPRNGGGYRYLWDTGEKTTGRKTTGRKTAGRKTVGMNGVFDEIARPARLVFTETWDEDWTGGPVKATALFNEDADSEETDFRLTLLYASEEARDRVLKSPMKQGCEQSYNRLNDWLLRSLCITRMLDTDTETAWRVWTEPEHVQNWSFTPKGFVTTYSEGDFTPGGLWRMGMRSPKGNEYHMQGTYLEITPPMRLVQTHQWLEAKGDTKNASDETICTIRFENGEHAGQTRLCFEQSLFASTDARDSHEEGWNEVIDKYSAYVQTYAWDRVKQTP